MLIIKCATAKKNAMSVIIPRLQTNLLSHYKREFLHDAIAQTTSVLAPNITNAYLTTTALAQSKLTQAHIPSV